MKMKKILLLTASLMAIWSCERDTETLGPNLSELYGEFSVLEPFVASRSSVNFGVGESVLFSGRFSKPVNWEIHIVGQSSGSEKVITGMSKLVDETNAAWTGTTTHLPMFKEEVCTAFITVPSEGFSDTLSGISIDSTKFDEGFVMADFESGVNPGWTVFAQSGADMSFGIVPGDSAAQGNNFWDMGGEVSFDYLIGLIDFPASAYGSATFPLDENANNVYFNVMLGKPEGITNEIILFQFREDENGDGIFQEATEDMYSLELKGISSDWENITIKYGDLQALINGAPADPAGNGIREPHKLLQVSMLFLADPSSGYSRSYMDYLIFTENGPLEP